jgi:hypothetical protein
MYICSSNLDDKENLLFFFVHSWLLKCLSLDYSAYNYTGYIYFTQNFYIWVFIKIRLCLTHFRRFLSLSYFNFKNERI